MVISRLSRLTTALIDTVENNLLHCSKHVVVSYLMLMTLRIDLEETSLLLTFQLSLHLVFPVTINSLYIPAIANKLLRIPFLYRLNQSDYYLIYSPTIFLSYNVQNLVGYSLHWPSEFAFVISLHTMSKISSPIMCKHWHLLHWLHQSLPLSYFFTPCRKCSLL